MCQLCHSRSVIFVMCCNSIALWHAFGYILNESGRQMSRRNNLYIVIIKNLKHKNYEH